MRGLRFSHGYLRSNPKYGIMILEPTESRMWETGSFEPRNIRTGSMASTAGNPTIQSCFATEIRGSVKPSLGKKSYLHEAKVLLRRYDSSLVIDGLCDWARGRNAAVACFYFDFAAREEQSPMTILSPLLKQVVSGLEEIPAEIVQVFRDQGKVIGGRKLELDETVRMLQDISASRPTFICLDALDECMAEYRTKLLDSVKQILQKSPSTRIFLAGRLHVRDEVEKHLAGRAVAVSITLTKDDIIRFLWGKLKEDTTPDAMDKRLEEDIIKNIPESVSKM